MKSILIFSLFFLFFYKPGNCQVTVTPSLPSTDDNITVIFDASKGNAALNGFTGTVYMHTGVITTASTSNSDWKYTIGNWGTADANVAMESLGNNLYRKTYNIRTFHSIPLGVDVLKLAFVFRNSDGTIVGRTSSNTDILITTNAYKLQNYVSNTFTNNKLTINAQNGKMTIEPFASNMAKIAIYPDGVISPDTTYSVVLSPSATTAVLTDSTDYFELNCGNLKVHIAKNPIRLSYKSNGITVLNEESGYFSTSDTKGLRFKISPAESFYGTGSRATPINKNGQSFYSYNEAHYSYSNGSSTLNINIPFIMSSSKYGIYIENRTAGNFNIGNSEDSVFQYTVEDGKLSYYVITGDSFDEILNNYTNLTGKQPLPPLWAMGFLQSRFGYQSETETRNTVDSILQDGFPLDAIILDLYWFGQLGDMGNFTWNSGNWPNATGMISDFKNLGVNTILISEPYVTQSSSSYSYCDSQLLFGTDASGNYTYIVPDFYAGSSGLLDIFKPETKDWMWSKYKARTDDGVAGWWCDVGEPENHPSGIKHVAGTARQVHNVYALEWASLLYNKYKQEYPNQRLFDLMRSGFAGMQRYSTFPWSGDVNRSFEGFQAQIPIMLGMGMSGVGYMHSDLGGFTGGSYNPELYTRWLQFGAFCPIMRPHGEGIASEPIYYPTNEKNIVRNFVKLRYQLMPYNYTLSWKNSETGRPLALPINYFEPTNSSIANVNDEFLWGENMLVAPVMSAGQTSRTVLFPSGKWFNYWTNQSYSGNSSSTVNAPLNKMPLFVKAGSFIPMVPVFYHTSDYKTDTLSVKYYPDISNSNSIYTMYEDDGKTPSANISGDFELLTFSGEVLTHQTNIRLSKSGNGYTGAPSTRSTTFEVQRQTSTPYAVFLNSTNVTVYTTQQTFAQADTGAYYDSLNQILFVKYLWNGSSDILVIANDNQYNEIDNVQSFSYYLQYPYPNPFTESITINYNILEKGNYSLNFYNAEGSLIKSLSFNNSPGNYSYHWNGKELSSGLYFISLDGKNGKQWMKVMKE